MAQSPAARAEPRSTCAIMEPWWLWVLSQQEQLVRTDKSLGNEDYLLKFSVDITAFSRCGLGTRFLSFLLFIYLLFDYFIAAEGRFGVRMMLLVSGLFLFVVAYGNGCMGY